MSNNKRNEIVSGSNLERVLKAGHFAVCGELGPPQGSAPDDVLRKCEYFRGMVDTINITDNQTAIVRMSSAVASVLTVQAGLEPVMQMTCRDRNRLAQQSDMLGAAALGVKNILCLTGDHARLGNHPQAKPVHDIDSTNLIAAMHGLREGRFMSGDQVKTPPKLFIGGAANPFGEPFQFRVLNLAKKIAAGADFFQTQPVFDMARFKLWMQAVCDQGLHEKAFIIAGVMPVRSVRALEHMQDNVAGVRIAPEYISRMAAKTDKDEAMAEGIAIAIEIIQEVRQIPGVAGVHIMPVMWESSIGKVVEGAGLLPRPVIPQDEALVGGEAVATAHTEKV